MITRMQSWIGKRVGINTINKVKIIGTLIDISQNGIVVNMNDMVETGSLWQMFLQCRY